MTSIDIEYNDDIIKILKRTDEDFYFSNDHFWSTIRPYLDNLDIDEESNILVMGSFLIAVLLHQRYNSQIHFVNCDNYNIDSTTEYCEVISDFFHKNDLDKFQYYDVNNIKWDDLTIFDVIISNSEWGLLYPLELYLCHIYSHISEYTSFFLVLANGDYYDTNEQNMAFHDTKLLHSYDLMKKFIGYDDKYNYDKGIYLIRSLNYIL